MLHRRLPAAIRTAALVSAFAIVLAACSGGATPAPTASPAGSPTAAPGELVLDRAPDITACDTIGVDYTSLTFRIDPTASPQIWADADTGPDLTVRWDSTFNAGTGATVVDKSGAVVLEDGDTLEVPGGAFPELKGHFVCTGPTGLIILDQAPS
ncbi:MAG: hypothetical protein L0227_08780 [Chloroflexi bacterium]|nr:hypothetical protein [Chloroflexota bacterium]